MFAQTKNRNVIAKKLYNLSCQIILPIIICQGCFPGTATTIFFTFGPKNRQDSFFFSQNKLDLFYQYL